VTVFDFNEYREYLQEYYRERKEQSYFWSYRFMADKLGIDHSLIIKIFSGQRHLKEEYLPKVVDLCKLNQREAEYFKNLYYYNKAKSDAQIKLYFEKMLALKSVTSLNIQENQYKYFQKWYYAAVRSVVEYLDFKDDYKTLAKHISPNISVKQAREAVQLLNNLGFIYKDKTGSWKLKQNHIQTPEKWKSLLIKNYQQECVQQSMQALDLFKKEAIDISTITMAIEVDKLSFIKHVLQACRESIVQQVAEMDNPNQSYQFNMQLFPVSKICEMPGRVTNDEQGGDG
jgi:uncharacterized protein (TIGR02147 family)